MTRDEVINQIATAFGHVVYPSVPVVDYEEPAHADSNDFWQIAQWLTGRSRESLSDWELFLIARFGHGLALEIVHYVSPAILIRALLTQDCEHLRLEAARCPFPRQYFDWQQRQSVVHYIEFVAMHERIYSADQAEKLIREWRAK